MTRRVKAASPNARLDWTQIETELLRYLLTLGISQYKMAAIIGRTRRAVQRKMTRLKNPDMRQYQPQYTAAMLDFIREKWVDLKWSAGLIANGLTQLTGRTFTRNMIIGKIYRERWGAALKKRKPAERQPYPGWAGRNRTRIPKIKALPRFPRAEAVVCAAPRGDTISFELNAGCWYPFGEGEPRFHTFCGAPKVAKSSYCGYHHARCYKTIRYKAAPATPTGAVGTPATVPPVLAGVPLLSREEQIWNGGLGWDWQQ